MAGLLGSGCEHQGVTATLGQMAWISGQEVPREGHVQHEINRLSRAAQGPGAWTRLLYKVSS